MASPVIHIEGLSKAYRIGVREEVPNTLTSAVLGFLSAPVRRFRSLRRLDTSKEARTAKDTIWALRNVSFSVPEGQVLGIIGHNGAGKSTILKILSRITEPTSGRAQLHGRVSSLLEVGTGFHPELTGRENVYLNGTILGMTKAEIDRKFDEISSFAGVHSYLDTPIKRYSSGMKVRLAFAVAAHLEPEILIIDEVLAVGDAEFQCKCMGKMQDIASQGRTVLFVSHNMTAVANLCSRVVMLDQGMIVADGPPEDVIQLYTRRIEHAATSTVLSSRTDREGSGLVRFQEVQFLDAKGHACPAPRTGQDVAFALSYRIMKSNPPPSMSVNARVHDSTGQVVFLCSNELSGNGFSMIPNAGRLLCRIPKLPLPAGNYTLSISCGSFGNLFDRVHGAAAFTVVEGDFFGSGRLPDRQAGMVFVDHSWSIAPE